MKTKSASGNSGASGACVLVVEDHRATRSLYARVLRRDGFEVVDAADGATALRLLDEHAVSMVLLDSQMPGMSGPELLRLIRADPRHQTLPVIFVTGESDVTSRVKGLDGGADDYLTKPVDIRELLARVRAHLRCRSAVLELVADLTRRAAVADVVGRLGDASPTVFPAQAICDEIITLNGVDGVAIVGFPGSTMAMPRAAAGVFADTLTSGTPLSAHDTKILRSRAQFGPWLEQPGSAELSEFVFNGARTAIAPLRATDRLLGVLLVTTGERDGQLAEQALSVAVDFASVTSALLRTGLESEDDLAQAQATVRRRIDKGGFVPHFQCIVELEKGSVVGYEALTRWSDGTRADIPFVEAREVGLGLETELATLSAAIEAARCLDPGLWLSVNASAELLMDPRLKPLLSTANRPLVVELTEQEPVADYAPLRRAIDQLGPEVRLAIDDAGAGYSSLRHILQLTPDQVKLDIRWVQELEHDPAHQALVAGLERFITEAGGVLIAEGIESEATRAILLEMGVRFGQGYLLGRPTPASELTVSRVGRR